MRVIARRTLHEYVASQRGQRDQSALKASLDAWFAEVRRATWRSSSDVRQHYATASIVSGDRVVFNIRGNHYRLVTAIDYEKNIVWIKWLGTHAEYDKIDVKTVAHERAEAD